MATPREKTGAKKTTATRASPSTPRKPAATPPKGTARKPAGATVKKTTRRPRTSRVRTKAALTPEDRHRRIAEAAYYLAIEKGFEKSDPRQNWLEAEKEIDG